MMTNSGNRATQPARWRAGLGQLLLAGGLSLAGLSIAEAATSTALSCSQTDVQNAINAANNGDTVLLPGGVCAWSSSVTIPSTKGITLDGNGATVSGHINLQQNANITSRITRFTFTSTNAVQTHGSKATAAFRVDHNNFTSGDVMLVGTI